MDALYSTLELLSAQPECRTCNLCERNVGLVYLIGEEGDRMGRAGKESAMTSEGVRYLERKQSNHGARWCGCFDVEHNQCTVYDIRPLCCRLYPIDLMRLDGVLWWIVHAQCPIAERFERERRLDVLAAVTVRLESELSPEQLRMWVNTDRASQTIEAFVSDHYRIVRLRRFGVQPGFP
jgi:hypothetical protein